MGNATIGGTDTGSVTEDGTLIATGLLTISDPDAGEANFPVQNGVAGTYGTLDIDASGNWTYTLDNASAAVQALPGGATPTDTITIHSTDGTTHDIIVTVHGANDAAVITGTDTGSVTEDGTLTATGTLAAADPDTGESNFTAQTGLTGTYGTLDIDASGNWTYTLSNGAANVQALPAGATPTDTIQVQSSDGTTHDIVVTVNGANDAAVITGTDTGSVTEDGTLTATGTLAAADPDTGESNFTAQTGLTGTYGTLDIDASGNWTYTLSNGAANVQALPAGATPTDTIQVQSSDGTTHDIVVTVNGANDAAVITGTDTGSVTEDGTLTATGTLAAADPDTGESNFTAQTGLTGTYGTLDIDASGNWTYTLSNGAANVQALPAGATPTDTIQVQSSDGTTHDIVVTVNGANDAAVITGTDTGSVTEDGTLTATGTLAAADPDTGESNFTAQTGLTGTYGTLDIDASGNWTYTLANGAANVQALPGGATPTDTIQVQSSDGTTHDIVVTVNGTNDAPVVDLNTGTGGIDDTNLYVEGGGGSGIGAAIGVSDPDTGDMIHGATIAISDPEAGDLLSVTLPLPPGITVDPSSTADFLVLTGTASASAYATALGQVGYSSSSDDPTAGGVHTSRSIGVTVNDGTLNSAPATMTMSVIGQNDEPTLTATGLSPIYTENGAAVDLFSNVTASTVEAGQTLTSLTITVTNVTDGSSEILGIDGSSVALTNGNSVTTATHGLNVGVSLSGSTATVTFTGASLSASDLQTLVDDLTYANSSENPTDANRVVTITQLVDSGSNSGSNDNTAALSIGATVNVNPVNDAPVFTGLDGTPSFTEGGAAVVLDSNATVIDPELTATNYLGATLTLARSGGAVGEDQFGGTGGAGLTLTGVGSGNVNFNGTTVGTYTQSGGTLTISFNASATQSLVNSTLQGLTYTNTSDNPPSSAVIAYAFSDGNAGAQGSGGVGTGNGSVTVSITGVDDPAVAVNDPGNSTNENATVNIAVLANDSDPDDPLSVAQINGNPISVGGTAILPSGATVKLEANGTLTYDPNGQFNTLVETGHGAVNTSAPDSFTYTLGGTGGGTATVSITVNGVASVQDHYNGDSGNNTITGTPNGDFFDLSQGGNDTATGLGGNDGFFFGAAFTAADQVDGGAGTNDQIGLQGNYTGGNSLVLNANTITNIEAIVVLPGFSYNITTNDGNVAAGGVLKVQATQLAAGQSLTFNGSAEHDGSFLIYGGNGNDTFTGGDGNDGFYFGPGGFNSSDTVNGGPGGNDQLGLDGIYGGFGPAFVLGGNVTNVEVVVLLPGPSGTPNTFNLTTSDAFVPAAGTMTIFGLLVTTDITFDGSHEHDGAFRIYGGSGNDVFTGSSGNDWMFGGGGSDTMIGGAGADTFYYDAASQSTSTGFDRIIGFDDSVDKIDLPFAVSGFATPGSGTLSTASFDADLQTAFAGLGNHEAGMFTATSGDMSGRTFLVIDADGNAGYQAGSDYVIEIITPVTPLDNPGMFV